MHLRYLETSVAGLRWMRAYYKKNPQLDRAKALEALRKTEQLLTEFERAGHPFQNFESVLEIPIGGTSFSILYTIARETVWIIDIRDQRGLRSAEALRLYTRELRRKHGIG